MESESPNPWKDLDRSLYDELRRLALMQMRGERKEHTLQPTALVHEAFLKLAGPQGMARVEARHFVAFASRVMRQVLVNHAARRRAARRGGGQVRQREPLDVLADAFSERCGDLVALHEALTALGQRDPLAARIVELRFFGGLTTARVAEVLGMSVRTVEREWQIARAYLRSQLEPDDA